MNLQKLKVKMSQKPNEVSEKHGKTLLKIPVRVPQDKVKQLKKILNYQGMTLTVSGT
jgi:hypothetical protein